MRNLVRAAIFAFTLAGLASPAFADDKETPAKMKQNGFLDNLDAATKKATQEGKALLLFFTPSYFNWGSCQQFERGAFASDEFKKVIQNAVPCRLCLDKDDRLLTQYKVNQSFPAFRLVSANGSYLYWDNTAELVKQASPAGGPDPFIDACAKVKKLEDAYRDKIKNADLSKPADRLDVIVAHLEQDKRGSVRDEDSARKAFDGWDEKDMSAARAKAMNRIGSYYLGQKRGDEVDKVLKDVEKLLDALVKDAEHKDDNVPAAADLYALRITKSVREHNKDLAFKLLDEAAEKLPESRLARDKETIKNKIQSAP